MICSRSHLLGMLMTNQDDKTEQDASELADSICLLVQSAREGCLKSQAKVMEQLGKYMAVIAAQKMNTAFQAKFGESDVVQQSIAVAIGKLDDFRGTSQGELFAWVRSIIHTQFLQNQRALLADKRNLFRERSIEPASSVRTLPGIADRFATPGTHAIRLEYAAAVEKALNQLSEEHQTVIRLRNWDQLSFPEIADRMNRSPNAVTKLWYRALIDLRKHFGPLEDSNDGSR